MQEAILDFWFEQCRPWQWFRRSGRSIWRCGNGSARWWKGVGRRPEELGGGAVAVSGPGAAA